MMTVIKISYAMIFVFHRGTILLITLVFLIGCKKDVPFDQDLFAGDYHGSSTSGIFNIDVLIEKSSVENELLIHDLRNYGNYSPLITNARIISETEFAIPDHVWAHHADSPGGGCTTCVSYPYMIKYNGAGVLSETGLLIDVNTYHKFSYENDFSFFKHEQITLVKQ